MISYIKELKELKKGKIINSYLREIVREYLGKSTLPASHQKAIIELLKEEKGKILEDFYVIEETDSEADEKKILKMGILKSDNYAKGRLGYIYEDDNYDLLGELAAMFIIKNEKLSRDIPDTTFVCEGATLECQSRGTTTQLKVLDSRRETLNGARMATKADKTLAEINFIKCGKSSCSFSSSDGWQEVSVGSISNDNEQLLNTSYIMCHKGSKIVILDANCEEIGN